MHMEEILLMQLAARELLTLFTGDEGHYSHSHVSGSHESASHVLTLSGALAKLSAHFVSVSRYILTGLGAPNSSTVAGGNSSLEARTFQRAYSGAISAVIVARASITQPSNSQDMAQLRSSLENVKASSSYSQLHPLVRGPLEDAWTAISPTTESLIPRSQEVAMGGLKPETRAADGTVPFGNSLSKEFLLPALRLTQVREANPIPANTGCV
eukprot:FR736289.1.p1 GENE.FR736289.1~~FR736289.1.p1  ORF type:complete len:239 (+),score=20.52 FR736289.1:84-719(+)